MIHVNSGRLESHDEIEADLPYAWHTRAMKYSYGMYKKAALSIADPPTQSSRFNCNICQ